MRKKILLLILGFSLMMLLFFFFQWYVPYRLENFINEKITKSENIEGSIGSTDISFFGTNWMFSDISLVSSSNQNNVNIKIEKAILHNINLYKILVEENIDVGLLKLINPNITINKTQTIQVKDEFPPKSLTIDNFEIEGGSISLLDKEQNDTLFSSGMTRVKLNAISLDQSAPFHFKSSLVDEAVLTELYTKINEFDALRVNHITFKNENVAATSLSLATELSKEELSEIIKTERDHTIFRLGKLEIKEFDFQMVSQHSSLSSSEMLLSNFDLAIYRDKLLEDDREKKRYYGNLLRNLPFQFDIQTVNIKNGNLTYAEKVKSGVKPESLVFEKIAGKFSNLQNFRDNPLNIKLSTQIMGEAILRVDYEMNPLDNKESFLLKGSLSNFMASSVNPFLRTSTGTTTKGYINQMFFTIDGNSSKAKGDIKMKYEDFEIQILKKDLLKINKVLSFLGNLFINDGSKSDEDGYRYGTIEMEPNVSKSFINYLWACLMDGMVDTVTGSGKKE